MKDMPEFRNENASTIHRAPSFTKRTRSPAWFPAVCVVLDRTRKAVAGLDLFLRWAVVLAWVPDRLLPQIRSPPSRMVTVPAVPVAINSAVQPASMVVLAGMVRVMAALWPRKKVLPMSSRSRVVVAFSHSPRGQIPHMQAFHVSSLAGARY